MTETQKPSKKMKALGIIRLHAVKEGFKIGSTSALRKKFKIWTPHIAVYQIKNHSAYKNLHYFRQDNSLKLYSPMSLKYDKEFLEIETKILSLPDSILEIIFFQSNIAIIWDEMQGTDELLKIKTAILNI